MTEQIIRTWTVEGASTNANNFIEWPVAILIFITAECWEQPTVRSVYSVRGTIKN